MKIVVNTRLLRKNQLDGIGWFTYNTMRRITAAHPDIEFHFLFDSGIEKDFLFSGNIVPVNLFPPAKHAILNIAWFEWSVKRYLQKTKADLFLSPDGILSLGWRGKQYGVVHDINFVHIPNDLKWSNKKFYNYFFPKYVRKAARIATVSDYSKQDIARTYGIEAGRIDVVYNGINDFFKPVDDMVRRSVKVKYTQGCDYFVFVGTLHPRKNILRLMQAFDLFKTNTGSDMKLVLAGKEMFRTNEMHDYKSTSPHGNDIIFTGRLEDEELKRLYASALCLTFVPYFEGFGIPMIEAMQCDVPVIAADVTSMPEIAGDAALLVDPYNIADIAHAMATIAGDPLLRQELILKGRIRKDYFSWDKTASLLWNSIEKIL